MQNDEAKINLLARVARSKGASAELAKPVSILSLSAAAYGARPSDEATVPTGFDPSAVALFEAIVEGAYLVASADGVFDDSERKAFERVVSAACGGAVAPSQVHALLADLEDQLKEDGLDRRIAALASPVLKKDHAREILRIAALLAQSSEDVSAVERDVLAKIARACGLEPAEVESALDDVKTALATKGE
jgi:tellurite resistance protein